MEIESFKVSSYVKRLVEKFCYEQKITKSDFFRKCLVEGIKSEKINSELKEMLKYAELEERFIEGDFKIKISLKKASLVENYKKLLSSLRNRKISDANYKDVKLALLERIKNVFGESSAEYTSCMRMRSV